MYTRELVYRLSDMYAQITLLIHLKTFREKQWLVTEPSRTWDKDIKSRTLLDIPGHIYALHLPSSNYEPFNISQITVVEIFTQILSFVTCAVYFH